MKNNLIDLKAIKYDENGYSISSFPKDDFKVKIRIDPPNSTIYIVREDNLLVLFKKKIKTKTPNLVKRRAKVYLMKFCNIQLTKRISHRLRGRHVPTKKI